MRMPPSTDFAKEYFSHFPPEFAQQVLAIIEGAAREAADYCEKRFPSGNFAPTQGHLRRQYINEDLFTVLQVDGITPETRGFRGQLLDGDERISNFVLLMAKDVGLTIYRASKFRRIPNQAPLREFLVALPFGMVPLFPEFLLDEASLPHHLKAMFFLAYDLDCNDSTGRTVGEVEVLVLDGDGKNVFAHITDVRSHARMVAVDDGGDDELPIAVRDLKPSDLPSGGGSAPIDISDDN